MKRLLLSGLAICIASNAALAEDRYACIARAQLFRDQCARGTGGDNFADRACRTQYLSALQRCQTGTTTLRPILPRAAPIQPQIKPVQPKINPVPRRDPIHPRPPGVLTQPLRQDNYQNPLIRR